MKKFRIKETEKIMKVLIYEVEAESEEDALQKYTDELAGMLEPIIEYETDLEEENVEDIIIIKD